MSLFENSLYQWRETYFVLFDEGSRPSPAAVQKALNALDARYQIESIREDDDCRFESCTVYSPHDFAAMDITYISGQEVADHIEELMPTLTQIADNEEEREKIGKLESYNARLDVFHFEQMVVDTEPEDEDEYLDPGSLLIVLERLAKLCGGVGVDPQSGAVL